MNERKFLMRKRNTILSAILSIAVIITGLGAGPICASALDQKTINPPRSIGSATASLEKKSSSSLSYRVTAKLNAISSSVTAKIVLQKNESNQWVDKQTITRTDNNVKQFDVTGTIDVTSYGSGSYRIKVTISDVYNGITDTLGPIYSGTVVI